ncbi:MAG: hypothetical protein L0G51_10785, partial [Lactococcus lactis]|nr:hypothetical protein [Lactococcus lactis]
HIGNHIITENLLERCKYYSGYTDRTTYVVEPIKGTDKIAISHRSPSLDTPESIEAFEEVRRFENYITLTMWAENSLEKNTLDANVDLPKAIEFIKSQYGLDIDIFEDNCDGWSDETTRKRMEQNAVAAVATMVLCFRKGLADTDLEWAREIISKILDLPFNSYECSTPEAQLVFHPKKFVSKALASEIKNGTYNGDTRLQLLFIIASPVNEVSISALNACFLLYDVDKKLAYSAMFLAISICHDYLKHRIYNSEDDSDLAEELYSLEYTVHEYFQSDDLIIKLPEYKSPWIELKEVKYRPSSNYHLNKFFDAIKWERSDEQWDTTFLSHVLKQLPTKELLHSEFKEELLNFIENLINWTIELIEPSWSEQYSHEDNHSSLYEFSDALCNVISTICEVLPFNETYSRFVEPILLLKSEECWQLIEPLVRYCSCKLYDESIVSEDVIKILERCLDRFLQIEELKNDCYRIGKFDVFKNNTLKSLMFTRITQFDSAKRFANGNWSEISLILPIIDRLVREAGWVSVVMKNFVQLCDHAKNDYPAEVFADQVLTVISKPKLVGWQGSTLYSRISELVQFFAERDNPLDLETGQKLLRIIDWLIDQGDRRSASLQQSELFRSIKVN